jgi:hypothetical protein
MNQITLTVPMDYNALTRASDMLHGLAIDVSKQGDLGNDDTPVVETPAPAAASSTPTTPASSPVPPGAQTPNGVDT